MSGSDKNTGMSMDTWYSLPMHTKLLALMRVPLWWPYVVVGLSHVILSHLYHKTLFVLWNWSLRVRYRVIEQAMSKVKLETK